MQSINFGQTISRASGLAGSTLTSVGVFMVLCQIVATGINTLFRMQLLSGLAASPLQPFAIFESGWYWGTMLTALVLTTISFSGAVSGMLMADRGEAVSIGDCFAKGLARLLPALGLLILWFIGIYIGFILLIVPGCILVAMWSVAFPALMGERIGVLEAFGRSRALTKGSRWKIFLLLLLMVIVAYAIASIVLAGMAVQVGVMIAAAPTSIALPILFAVLGTLFGLATNALLVAIYGELVDLKGERVSEVFG